MTDHQLEQLKKLLDASHAPDNSPELDQRILNAAQNTSRTNREQSADSLKSSDNVGKVTQNGGHLDESPQISSLLHSAYTVMGTSVIQSAAFSVAIVLSLFFLISQMIMVEPAPLLSRDPQADSPISFTSPNGADYSDVDDAAVFVDRTLAQSTLNKPKGQPTRDRLLAAMTLPHVDVVLNDMPFTQANHCQSAEKVVRLAMSDIRIMLDNGKLDNARLRYAQLKTSCEVCKLPETLDDFAVTYQQKTDQS